MHHNNLSALAESGENCLVQMPNLKELLAARNQFANDQSLDVLQGSANLMTLDISSNQFSELPKVLWCLTSLRRLDIGANLLRSLPQQLGTLPELAFLSWEGNPLRSAPRNVSMAQLIESLRTKATLEDQGKSFASINTASMNVHGLALDEQGAGSIADDVQEDMAEDNKRIHGGLATAAPAKSTADASVDTEPIKASGALDLSRKGLDDVDSTLLTTYPVTLNLSYNGLTKVPMSLEMLSSTLVNLKLDHNKLESISLKSSIVFTALKTLDISHNRLSVINAGDGDQISFPKLTELIVNFNTITSLPENLRDLLPCLQILRANSNKIEQILPSTLQGLEIIDLANNDIAKLPPEIGLITSIRELVLYGNR